MLVAALLVALGCYGVAAATRLRGYRMGGTIVLGLLVVMTLKSLVTLLVFLPAAIVAYHALGWLERHTLIYGRDEFLAALLVGSAAPLALLGAIYATTEVLQTGLLRPLLVGSLLPGIAAFNHRRVRPEHRRRDITYALGLFAALFLLGLALVGPWSRPLAGLAPPVLFSPTSDVAVLRGAAVPGYVAPPIAPRPTVLAVFAVAAALSEGVRRRYGLRIGVVSLGLVALYTLADARLTALFVGVTAALFLVARLLHRGRYLYGRALLGALAGTGVVFATLGVAASPIGRGLSGLFLGVLAGLAAYNLHVTPPAERRQLVAVAVGVFVPLLVVARAVVAPFPAGFPQRLTALHVVLAFPLVVVCFIVGYHRHVAPPDDEAVRSASVLWGGES